MKPRDTRPGPVALDASSRKVTTPGVTPRPPTVDDDVTIPRRHIDLGDRGPVSDPLGSQPLLGAALEASLSPTDTVPGAPPAARSLGDTAPDPRPPFSASSALEHTPLPGRIGNEPRSFADTAPSSPPALDDALDDLAQAAKKTDMIPERADSDGARNARFATEGRPARAIKMTMPTGEVLVDPDIQERPAPPSAEVDLEGMAVEPSPRRRSLPTAPSGRVLELEENREYRREGTRGIIAGVSIALALLALLLIGILVSSPKKPNPPATAGSAVVVPVPAASSPSGERTATVVSPIPPPVAQTGAPAAPVKSSHVGAHPASSGGKKDPVVPGPTAPAIAPPPTPPAPPQPATAAPVPTDITHNIN